MNLVLRLITLAVLLCVASCGPSKAAERKPARAALG